MRLTYEILMLKGILLILLGIIRYIGDRLGYQFPMKQIYPLILIALGIVEVVIGYFGKKRNI